MGGAARGAFLLTLGARAVGGAARGAFLLCGLTRTPGFCLCRAVARSLAWLSLATLGHVSLGGSGDKPPNLFWLARRGTLRAHGPHGTAASRRLRQVFEANV